MVLVLLSCGREPTAPHEAPARFARGFSFRTIFPEMSTGRSFADVVDFNRVRVVLHRADGSVALDSMVTFPPGVDALTLTFDIRLSPGTPATGEPLTLDLAYLNAAGETVFTGGPVTVLAVPTVAGTPPPAPVSVTVVYTGPGASARSVRIAPRTLSVNTGASFAFTATGLDATGAVVPAAPIAWSSLDPARATITSATAGNGTALTQRGTARIVAQLVTAVAADTVLLTINPVPTNLAVVSGSGQSGVVGKPSQVALPQPIVVRVTAADGLGVAGVPVTFAAANGGTVTPATATTDATGQAQASWRLGSTPGAQTATASATGLTGSPVTFSATATKLPATKLAITSGPAAGSSVASGVPMTLIVAAQDVDGDLVTGYTGTVNVALGANPAGGSLSGTGTATFVGGIATVSGVSIAKPGSGYTLQATSGTLTPAATGAFSIVTGPAAYIVLLSGGGQTAEAGTAVAPITVLVTDANGNARPGTLVDFAAATGGGSVSPTTVATAADGKASTTWTLGATTGTQTLTANTTGVTQVTVSATAAPVVRDWFITQQPASSQTAGATVTPALRAELRNTFGAVVTSFSGTVTLAIGANPGSATLSGTTSVSAAAGVAIFSNVTLNRTGTGYTLVVSSSGATSGTSTAFNVTPATSSSLTVFSGDGQTGPTGAALPQPIVARVTDALGNGVPGVTISFASTSGGGSVTPTSGSSDSQGKVSTTWTLGSGTATQTLGITSTGLPSASATATATSATRTLVITQQPGSSQTAGVSVTPAVTVEMRDGLNALVTSFTGTVTLAIGTNPSGATLGGTTSVNAVAGVATFSSVNLNKSGTGYTLVASSTGATSATSAAFNVVPAAASALVIFSGNGQSGSPSTALPQPVVAQVTDAFGNGIAARTVTFAVASGGGSVTPTTGSTDAAGKLSASWTLGATPGAQTLSIASTGLTTVTATATASTGSNSLVITQQPASSQTAGATVTPALKVEMRDGTNSLMTSFTGTVTLAIGANPGGATLGGTTSVSAVAGVATFSGVNLNKSGTGYTLVVSSSGATSATTNAFDVTAAAASALVIFSGNGQTAAASTALPQPLVAQVTDAFGNGVAARTVNFAVTSGGGSVTPTTGSTDAAGKLSTSWTLGATVGAQTLDISSTGLTTISATATATSTATTWVITTQPGASQTAGAAVTPSLVAELRTSSGAVVTTFNGSTTVALGANPGGSTLAGTTTVTAASGVATFSNVTLNKVGTGYTLVVNSSGATSATTSAFDVIAGAAAALSIQSGDAQSGSFNTALSAPVVAKVTDNFGNPVAGRAVTFTVASGGGSVGSPTATSSAAGLASSTWTLGPSGPQTLTIASTGLSGSPITATATTGTGSVATTIVSPRVDTLTALGATRSLSAQARDASNNSVAGTFTWVSRNASVASVSSSGLVTAMADGTTYVVATETGGTKDSAQITVQQRIATINVTPGTRSLYVGGSFTFTAQAVDGRGNAMSSQPTFTWSSTVPSVITVNASTGVANAVAVGSAQIRATSGATVGVSNVTVVTRISRIDVTFDSTGAPAPDNYTMTALGLRRMYRAIAFDTLPTAAPMTGVTFTWYSTNASVAFIDSTTGFQARAVSAANGTTSIQASAQGVTGSATLNVSQVLSSIELTPPTAVVAVSGTTSMLARGKDSQGRYISGGSFTYTSAAPSIASVNSTTGVVTGASLGTTNITASSGAITSAASTITVSSSGPAVISFGRDTIGVGRGTSISVPILLSKPSGSIVAVYLAVADTFAYWSSSLVTIAAGATSANATLNGRNAGTTFIMARDTSGTGYAGDTAVVKVQANLRMTNSSYSMNQTSSVATQVLLSDPSPAGGTYVTFTYGTSGVVSTSPDPAFIPAGQLAADVVLTGTGAGTTSITPSATGVSGAAATVYVAAAQLNIPYTTLRLGAGQTEQYQYVQTTYNVSSPLTVTLTSTDTTVARSVPSATIPAGNYYSYFPVSAFRTGVASIIGTASGWTPDTLIVTSTTPKVLITGGTTIATTSPARSMYVYSADSTRYTHNRTSSLAVRMSSSDTTVIRVIDTLVTIAAGSYYNTGQVVPGGSPGTAWVRSSASGHTSDSVSFTVTGPSLYLSYNTLRVGVGQVLNSGAYVQIPNPISTPLVVTLTNSDTTKGATNPTVTIPAGNTYTYFDIRGNGAGTSTVIASASGYSPDTATNLVTTPRVRLTGGSTISAYQTSYTNVYSSDSLNSVHNRMTDLTVTLRSSDTTILKVDTLVVIPAGLYYVPSSVNVTAVNPGTVKIYSSAPGHLPDSNTWTVSPAKLNLSFTNERIGARQNYGGNAFYTYLGSNRTIDVPLTYTRKRTSIALSTTADTIPAGQSYKYFGFSGVTPGRDTIIVSAPGYLPDTGFVIVTTPQFRIAGLGGTYTTTNPPVTVTLYVADSTSNVHYASDTVVVRAVSSDSNVVRPGQPYFRILKGDYYAAPTVLFMGPGTATITYSDSAGSGYSPATSGTITVTGPSLAIAGSNPGRLGTQQHTSYGSYYVYTPNSVGTDLVVSLTSSDPRVATVPATVTIPAGQSYLYFTITAQDTIGTVQISANATGYSPTSVNMQVTIPKFTLSVSTTLNTTSQPSQFTVYATDANGQGHPVNRDVVVTLASSAPGVATIDSTTVTIPADQYYTYAPKWRPVAVGTAQLSASDLRSIRYPYTQATANVSVVTPTAYTSVGTSALGIGQYVDHYVSVPDATSADLTIPISHAAVPRSTTPASVTITAGTSYAYFRVTGSSTGRDTLTLAPAGHNPATGYIVVGAGHLDAYGSWPSSLRAGDSTLVYFYTLDPNGTNRNVAAAETFTLTPNANLQFVSGGSSSSVITSMVVPADASYVTVWVKAVSSGTGSVSITNSRYLTYTNSMSVTP